MTVGTDAIAEIAAERRRQIEVEGWTPEHDDEHRNGAMAKAAACYAYAAALAETHRDLITFHAERGGQSGIVVIDLVWPSEWARKWWKPKDRRRDLVRAGALIVAEIERLDRAAAKHPETTNG